LTGVIDALFRSSFLVRTFWVFAAAHRAAPVAQAINPIGLYPAEVLTRATDRAAADGFIDPLRFSPWVVALLRTPMSTALLPIVQLVRAAPPGTGDDFHFAGSYVVRRVRAVARLTPAQTALWLLVAPYGETEVSARPMVQMADGAVGETFTIEAHRSRIRWTPHAVHIDATVTATLEEMGRKGETPLGGDGPSAHRQTQVLAHHLAQQILALVRWSQVRGLDLFSIGRVAETADPAWFRQHAGHWTAWYRHVPVTVHITANLETTGNLKHR
jgi:hypothetical protein